METARILTCYYRPKPGGFCTRLFRAMQSLLNKGHTVHYLAVEKFPIEHNDCHFHRFPWPARQTDNPVFWIIFHLCAPFYLIFIGIKHRITHCFAFGSNYGFLLQPLRIIKTVPLTLFLRADLLHTHTINNRSVLLVRIDHLIEGLSMTGTRVYGVSDHITMTVLDRHRYFKPSTSGTLRNNIDKIHKPTPGNSKTPLKLGTIGVLETLKNQELVINLLPGFHPQSVQLHIFGNGPKKCYLKALSSSLNVLEMVTFHGWAETEDIFSGIDLLLMTSLQEGSPNAVLEALSRGVPVFASDIPGHREILPESALLPLDNLTLWKSHINNILNKETYLQAIVMQQQEFATRLCFDWDGAVSDLILMDSP